MNRSIAILLFTQSLANYMKKSCAGTSIFYASSTLLIASGKTLYVVEPEPREGKDVEKRRSLPPTFD